MGEMTRLRQYFRERGMDDCLADLYCAVHAMTDKGRHPQVFERKTLDARVGIALGRRIPGQNAVFETIDRMFDDEQLRMDVFADYLLCKPWWACPDYGKN